MREDNLFKMKVQVKRPDQKESEKSGIIMEHIYIQKYISI